MLDSFHSIESLSDAVRHGAIVERNLVTHYAAILKEYPDTVSVLKAFDQLDFFETRYFLFGKVIWIGRIYRINLLPFVRQARIGYSVTIIGFHDILIPGMMIAQSDVETQTRIRDLLQQVTRQIRGITAVTNLPFELPGSFRFQPQMVFHNTFADFDTYVAAMKLSRRKDIRRYQKKSQQIQMRQLDSETLTEEHYQLYISVHDRAIAKDAALPLRYFQTFAREFHEFRDGENHLIALYQLREMDHGLYPLRIGFNRDVGLIDPAQLRSIDTYYAVMLQVIRFAIEHGYRSIEFGPTAEQAKSKMGCVRERRYVFTTSSNPLLRLFFRHGIRVLMKPDREEVLFSPFMTHPDET